MLYRAIDTCLQGPISSETNEVIENWLRCYWINQVIVSTWEGSEITHPNPRVKIVLSHDPHNPGPNNVNRQLISTKRGLQEVTTRFCIKSRTDLWPKEFNIIGPEIYRLLNNSRVNREIYYKIAVLGDYHGCLPFLVPDFLTFGSTTDIKKLWSTPLNPSSQKYNTEYSVPTETYLFFHWFEKLNPNVRHYWDNPVEYLSVKGHLKEEPYQIGKQLFNKLFIPLNLQLWWPKKGLK